MTEINVLQLPRRLLRRASRQAAAWRRQHTHRRFYRQFVPHGGLCFDVGANVGNRVALFLALGARVVAVEPAAETAAILRQHHGTQPALTILETALGAHKGGRIPGQCSHAGRHHQ